MSQLFDEEIQRELVALSRQLPNDDRLADRIINAAQVGSRSPRRRRVAVGPWLAAAAVVVGVSATFLVIKGSIPSGRSNAVAPPPSPPVSAASTTPTPSSSGQLEGLPTVPIVNPPGRAAVGSWRLLSTQDQGRRLNLFVTVGGSCERLDYLKITESVSSVTITPVLRTGLHQACSDVLGSVRGWIDLRAPLGDRSLVHGNSL
jgi:hypothetical protein